jgi:membrane protein implicated in regulation of membrane protease activity
MVWWMWVLLALALFGVEVLTPGGFYFLLFAHGALVVGGLAATGALESIPPQVLLFSVGSVAALQLFRRPLLTYFRTGADHEVDSLRQDVAVLSEPLPAHGVGRAELRGTTWNVRSLEERDLAAGQRCRVERVEGLTLWVRAE